MEVKRVALNLTASFGGPSNELRETKLSESVVSLNQSEPKFTHTDSENTPCDMPVRVSRSDSIDKETKRFRINGTKEEWIQKNTDLLNSWLLESETKFSWKATKKWMKTLEIIVSVLEAELNPKLVLIPVFIYADKYVKATKKLYLRRNVEYILMISLLISIKFWGDAYVNLGDVSLVFGIPLKNILELEHKFLRGVGWNLVITAEDEEKYELKKFWNGLF